MKLLEKTRKKEPNSNRRFYSDYVDDKMDMYSVSKMFAEKNEEKVIRINWFCKNNDITLKCFQRIVNGLVRANVVTRDCKLVF